MFDYVYEDMDIPFHIEILKEVSDVLPQKEDIKEIAPLIWGEHCLECSAPQCYKTCRIYESDRYGRCKRTEYGVRTWYNDCIAFPAVQLRYRKWGKLRSEYNCQYSYSYSSFRRRYDAYLRLRKLMFAFGQPFNKIKRGGRCLTDAPARIIHHNYIKKFRTEGKKKFHEAEELVFAFYSFGQEEFSLILDGFEMDGKLGMRFSYKVKPGYNLWRIACAKLHERKEQIYALELYPRQEVHAEIIFFLSDMITFNHAGTWYQKYIEKTRTNSPADKAKCVIWDLDNTLWDGIIGEGDEVKLRKNVSEIIKKLDSRGVLQSVCSKNEYQLAWDKIREFGLDEYFLYPQINWEPKSENIKRLEKLLNINRDTFVFIDDSDIERQEIMTLFPDIRVYSDQVADSLLFLPEFDLPVTEESVNRRKYYMSEMRREAVYEKQEKATSYREFIRLCGFHVEIADCKDDREIDRCHELIQRTNQLNASGNRIEYAEFREIVLESSDKVLRISCKDDFGEYGIVGCLILKCSDRITCTDMVFSCRIAKKKVENAVISSIMRFYEKNMDVIYYPTERNKVLLDELTAAGGDYQEERHRVIFRRGEMLDDDWVAVHINDRLSGSAKD